MYSTSSRSVHRFTSLSLSSTDTDTDTGTKPNQTNPHHVHITSSHPKTKTKTTNRTNKRDLSSQQSSANELSYQHTKCRASTAIALILFLRWHTSRGEKQIDVGLQRNGVHNASAFVVYMPRPVVSEPTSSLTPPQHCTEFWRKEYRRGNAAARESTAAVK